MAVEWVVLSVVVALMVGALAGYLLPGGSRSGKARVQELEAELEQARSEMSEYRADVYNQFSETADRFRAFDASYHALHRQLATSAVALCGEQATPLLTSDSPSEAQRVAQADVVTAGVLAAEQPTDETADAEVSSVELESAGTKEEGTPVSGVSERERDNDESGSDEPAGEAVHVSEQVVSQADEVSADDAIVAQVEAANDADTTIVVGEEGKELTGDAEEDSDTAMNQDDPDAPGRREATSA